MSPPMGILAAKAPFDIKWITLDREVSKTVISHEVARYDSSIKRDIQLKLEKKNSHEIKKKFHMRLIFETQFKIEFNTTVYRRQKMLRISPAYV